MTGNQDLEVKALGLFEQALEQASADRQQWIIDNTRNNDLLREKVLALLNADQTENQPLQTGAALEEQLRDVEAPETIGAYKITEKIGQGGMGAVFKGERNAGDFSHTVAIKIIKPGLLSDKLKPRFHAEQQILANFSHPNIARLYDGGETPEGLPFIIMEHVQGASLTEWADTNNLDLDARLSLLIQVCEAVTYAHQNLIVHRDLTPNNVLVTEQGEVKLIDFGIAKPHENDVAEQSQTSSTASLSLTPGFSAPERSTGAVANVKMDIFSLGKLLAALLKSLSHYPELMPELIAIVDKATADNPDNRYITVQALQDDLQRFLDDKAVLAYAGGAGYKLNKFYRRNRVGVSFATLLIAGLIIGFGTTSYLYHQAEEARALANKRFADVRNLATTMMFDIYDEIDAVPGTLSAKLRLAGAAQNYLDELASSRDATDSLKMETAKGYIRLADIYGSPRMSSTGEHKEARANLARAKEIVSQFADAPALDVARLSALRDMAFIQATQSFYIDNTTKDANTFLREAQDFATQALALAPDDLDLQLDLLQIEMELAINERWANNMDKAHSLIDQVLAGHERLKTKHVDSPHRMEEYAKALRTKAEFLSVADTAEQALPFATQAIELEIQRGSQDPQGNLKHLRAMAYSYWRRATPYRLLQQHAEAVKDFENAIQYINYIVERDPGNLDAARLLASYQGEAAVSLVELGEYSQAETYMLASKDYFKKRLDKDPQLGSAQRAMMVVFAQMSAFYKGWGKDEERCKNLSALAEIRDIMAQSGNLNDSDRAGIEAFLAAEAPCPT